MLLEVVVTVVILFVSGKYVYRWWSGRCTSKASLKGKTVIVTGASAGIGRAAAEDLACRGARVILACRNLEKACRVAAEIRNHVVSGGEVVVRKVDTSDLASVRSFAQQILDTEKSLHILINNAGIFGPKERQMTQDGFELTMATNHYGHFLLTNLLLGLLKQTSPSQIINVSSHAHYLVSTFDIHNLNFMSGSYCYSPLRAYKQSKLCNVLFTKELDAKLQGTGVSATSLHPGLVATEILSKDHHTGILNRVGKKLCAWFGKDIMLGAQTIIHLATADNIGDLSGKYFNECKVEPPLALAEDAELSRKLWEVSEVAVKLEPSERHY